MKNALAPVAALLIGVSILLAGSGLQGTLLPVRASLEAFSTLAIGTMGAAYFLGFTLGCLKGGQLVKNVGHVRVFLAMTALGSAAPLLHGLILNPLAWGVLRFLTGFVLPCCLSLSRAGSMNAPRTKIAASFSLHTS